MNKLRICIPTKDEETIFKGHMGDSKEFMIYDLSEEGDYKLVEKRESIPFEEREHGSQKKMEHILKIVGDCEVFIGNVLSPNFLNIRDKKSIQPVVSKISSVEELLKAVSKEFKVIYDLVQMRKRGERPHVIPEISESEMKMRIT